MERTGTQLIVRSRCLLNIREEFAIIPAKDIFGIVKLVRSYMKFDASIIVAYR